MLFAVAVLATLGLGSCKECVDCSSTSSYGALGKVCKSDYEGTSAASVLPWSTYKASLTAAGCK
jgi:hypothetical protein